MNLKEKTFIDEEGTKSLAVYSECENYRYLLRRTWDESGKKVLFIALNPSTATERVNDPTIRRIIGFAQRLGYGSVTICNLFAYRATHPKDLKAQQDPIGQDNEQVLQEQIKDHDLTIAAWGNHGEHLQQGTKIKKMLTSLNYAHFGITKVGEPKHPLYLKNNTELQYEHEKEN